MKNYPNHDQSSITRRSQYFLLFLCCFFQFIGQSNTKAADLTTLYSFGNSTYGSGLPTLPISSLFRTSDGNLYGVTQASVDSGVLYNFLPGTGFSTIHTFAYNSGYPYYQPSGTLVDGKDGFFYGTASNGGNNGYGVVYQTNKNGYYQVMHSLGSIEGTYPQAELLLGGDGYLYGTTYSGGAFDRGTVFKIKPNYLNPSASEFSVIHNFSTSEGSKTEAALVKDSEGNLYGTTLLGGTAGYGTIFKMKTDGTVIWMRSFSGTDGDTPHRGLLLASDGYLYGTTADEIITGAYGKIFRVSTSNTDFSIWHTFGSSGGDTPIGGLVEGADGYLYGMTNKGGALGYGTVYRVHRITKAFETMWNFQGFDGKYPRGQLTFGLGGKLYGTTYQGSALYLSANSGNGWGTIFEYQIPNWNFYSLTTSNQNGSVTKSIDQLDYTAGTVVSLTATPAANYIFTGWSGDASGTQNPLSVTVNSNINIQANFSGINYTINTSTQPNGVGSTTAGGTYMAGSTRSVTATPATGYAFVNWTENGGSVSNSATYTFTLTGNRNLTANFTAISRVISLSGNLAFGNVITGQPSTRSLTISNTGNTPLNISNISCYPSVFSGSFSGPIPAGDYRVVTVSFNPTAVVAYSGNVTVNSDATSGSASLPLSGSGINDPSKSDVWDFGDDIASGATNLGLPTFATQTHGSHKLSNIDLFDWFRFTLNAGVEYNFNTSGGTGDDFGELYDNPASSRLAYDDDGSGGQQFSLTYIPTSTGIYYLRVKTFSIGNTANYTLNYSSYGASAQVVSPTDGSSLNSSNVTFYWTDGDSVSGCSLYVSDANGNVYFNGDMGSTRSQTVSGLPTDGRVIYVQLGSRIGGTWQYNYYSYTAQNLYSRISISGDMLFGVRKVNTKTTRYLYIYNTGNLSFRISGIKLPQGFIGKFKGTVRPNSRVKVKVSFYPRFREYFHGTLTVRCNATSGTNSIGIGGVGGY